MKTWFVVWSDELVLNLILNFHFRPRRLRRIFSRISGSILTNFAKELRPSTHQQLWWWCRKVNHHFLEVGNWEWINTSELTLIEFQSEKLLGLKEISPCIKLCWKNFRKKAWYQWHIQRNQISYWHVQNTIFLTFPACF